MNIERLKELRERLAESPTFELRHLLPSGQVNVCAAVALGTEHTYYDGAGAMSRMTEVRQQVQDQADALNALRQDLLTALDEVLAEQEPKIDDFDLKAFGADWAERE